MNKKICIKCNEQKNVEGFSFRSDSGKYNNTCKKCKCNMTKKYYENNTDKVKYYQKKYAENNKSKILNRNKQYYEDNKIEINIKNTERRKKNPNYQKENYRKNIKDRHLYSKEYRNRPYVKKRRNENRRNRLKNDIEYRLKCRASSSIRKYLRKNGYYKNGGSFFKNINYTPTELKNHLESKFEKWMTWDNWGVYKIGEERRWNIDHIIPQRELFYDSMKHPNFKKCWSLENLRPLDGLENIQRNYE